VRLKGTEAPKKDPVTPKKSGDLEELIRECHKKYNRGGNVGLLDHYFDAVQLGFKGHQRQWADNIVAGSLVEGDVDLTPKKLLRRFR
jgi:hypothetical protein